MGHRMRNIRAAIAWRLFDVGDAIERLAHKVCDEAPTVSTASSEWFAEGRRIGHRAGLIYGMATALTAWQTEAGEGEGPPAALAYCLARDAGLDGGIMVQRVADAARALEATR